MTLDISLEAIEAELAIASRGGQVATIALARAQVLATLLAVQPVEHQGRHEAEAPVVSGGGVDVAVATAPGVAIYTVPDAASWDDRVTAAAMLLGIPVAYLGGAVRPLTVLADPLEAPTEEEARAGEPEEEGDDFSGRDPVGGLPASDPHAYIGEEDDVDTDFFAEAKRARKRK